MYHASKRSWSSADHTPTSQHSHCFSQAQCSTFEWEHVFLSRQILLTVLRATSSMQFSLSCHWHVYIFWLRPKRWESEVRPNLQIDNVLFLHDNARPHASIRPRKTIAPLGWTTQSPWLELHHQVKLKVIPRHSFCWGRRSYSSPRW